MKFFLTMLGISIPSIFFGGLLLYCDDIQIKSRDYTQYRKDRINHLEYYKDTKTNLCYALDTESVYVNPTNVPCSPAVEKLLK